MADYGKEDLACIIAKKMGKSTVRVQLAVNFIFDAITVSLLHGETVAIPGFGEFNVQVLPERPGVNPKTREKVLARSLTRARFRPERPLSRLINNPPVRSRFDLSLRAEAEADGSEPEDNEEEATGDE